MEELPKTKLVSFHLSILKIWILKLNFKVFGEYTDYRKFYEFYKTLYGIEQHTKLIQKIEDTCQEIIYTKYPKAFNNLTMEDKKEMLIELIGYDKKKKILE